MDCSDETIAIPASDAEAEARLDAPVIVGYATRERRGEGGFAEVYLGERHADGRLVAIKVLRRHLSYDPTFRQRFLAELEVTRTLEHLNIVEVLDGGIALDGRPYIVMELLVGQTLTGLLAAKRRLEPAEALAILDPIAAALELAHGRGIVHRDVKAGNVMLVGEPPNQVVKLLDFGVAKAVNPGAGDPRLTVTGVRVGSLNVMAPEQIRCQAVDGRTDVYALGVLLYRLIVGAEPFRGERHEVERMHLQHPPPRPSAAVPVPPSIDDIVARCMAKDPAQRFPTAGAVIAALRDALAAAPPPDLTPHDAVIVCVESLADPADDAAIDDMLIALEEAEAEVRAAGMAIAADTGNGFVASIVLDDEPASRARQTTAITALVTALQVHPLRIAVDTQLASAIGDARLRPPPGAVLSITDAARRVLG